MREYVEYEPAETAKLDQESYYDVLSRVLNNFFFHFALGPAAGRSQDGMYRSLAKRAGDWDSHPEDGSAKIQSQTYAEFYAEVDAAALETGMKSEDVSAVLLNFFNDSGMTKLPDGRYKEVWDALLPVYIALRKRGYISQELIS